jgi:hypothetical protein
LLYKIRRKPCKPLVLSLRPALLENHILAFNVSQIAQCLEEGIPKNSPLRASTVVNRTDAVSAHHRLSERA